MFSDSARKRFLPIRQQQQQMAESLSVPSPTLAGEVMQLKATLRPPVKQEFLHQLQTICDSMGLTGPASLLVKSGIIHASQGMSEAELISELESIRDSIDFAISAISECINAADISGAAAGS